MLEPEHVIPHHTSALTAWPRTRRRWLHVPFRSITLPRQQDICARKAYGQKRTVHGYHLCCPLTCPPEQVTPLSQN